MINLDLSPAPSRADCVAVSAGVARARKNIKLVLSPNLSFSLYYLLPQILTTFIISEACSCYWNCYNHKFICLMFRTTFRQKEGAGKVIFISIAVTLHRSYHDQFIPRTHLEGPAQESGHHHHTTCLLYNRKGSKVIGWYYTALTGKSFLMFIALVIISTLAF